MFWGYLPFTFGVEIIKQICLIAYGCLIQIFLCHDLSPGYLGIYLSTYISIYLRATSKLKKGERAISVVAAPPCQ